MRNTHRPPGLNGIIPLTACRADQRVSWTMRVPSRPPEGEAYPLAVIVHGTERGADACRDAMTQFCEEMGVAVLCPLFPAGIEDPNDLHNYKFIEYRGIRFDHLLFEIIDDAAAQVPLLNDRFLLQGFSGGAQFVQRMLLLHPERLAAVSIGAAGRYTLLDSQTPWWLGTADLQQRFGVTPSPTAMAEVPVQLLVGEDDTDTSETMDRSGSNWTPGLEKQGENRQDRIRYYQQNLAQHGIDSTLQIMPGVGHEGLKALPYAAEFFTAVLQQRR